MFRAKKIKPKITQKIWKNADDADFADSRG